MSRKYIMNIKFGKCQRELVNCFIFTPRPPYTFFLSPSRSVSTVCIINFLLPKWWNVDVMLIKNINFNEFQTDRIFHLWRLFSPNFFAVYSSLSPIFSSSCSLYSFNFCFMYSFSSRNRLRGAEECGKAWWMGWMCLLH